MQPREIAIIILIFMLGAMFILSGCGEIPVDTDSVERELDETQTVAKDLSREIELLRLVIDDLELQLERCNNVQP